ncbi:hypothetical protein [Parasphingorhabdus sp.]|uniref:hypothetical protein n=1 Tax=Parasphingorhabdus sp. TaxID=2709688 RepID=UPI003A9091B6
MLDGKIPLKQQSGTSPGTTSVASDLQLFGAVAIFVFASTLLFYGFSYSVHQDLGGSALSGRLAVTLGESFRDYSIYFPPAEKFWFSLAAHLSSLTGLRLDLVVIAMTDIMVLFGAGLAFQIRRATVGASPLFFISSVAVLVIIPILFKNVFGLREHMVVLGLWPYLVLRFSDQDGTRIGWRLRMVLGLWMGATLLFKTFYAVVVLLVEITDSLIERRLFSLFRIENVTAGIVVFLYLFFWLGLDPYQREVIGAMMGTIDANLLDRNQNWLKLAENLMPAILMLIASCYFRIPKRLIAIACVTVIAAALAAWSQERWYSHHLLPITMAYIAWWWIAARQFRWFINIAVALLILLPVAVQFLNTRIYQEQSAELEQALENDGRTVAAKRVAVLTMHPSPYNQYLASHDALRWNPMMNIAYVAAELKPFDKMELVGKTPPVKLDDPGRLMLYDQMMRLWEDMPPDVLILDRTYRWPLRHIDIDWIHVFSEQPRFNTFLKNYRPVAAYDGDRVKFTYYVRAR